MHVEFSHPAKCWTWRCVWGHFAFDFESQTEAEAAFLSHVCDGAA